MKKAINLNIDILNTVLIILSLILAFIIPFKLFLLAYAILGPLHYLTEINWLRSKSYFTRIKYWPYLFTIFAFLIALPKLLELVGFKFLILNSVSSNFTNVLIFIILLLAFAFTFFKSKRQIVITVSIGILLSIIFFKSSVYGLWIGILLPTLIHVYIFTILFMVYGNLKSKSTVGYVNIILMILIPFFTFFYTIDSQFYHFSETTKETILDNRFHVLNVSVSKLLGFSDGTQFFFYETLDIKIQIFIAFAYLYHYLNWFTKTTIIGWHKSLNKKSSIVITLLWLISVILYFYNYKIGLTFLLALSLAHVFGELPLNFVTIKTISQSFFQPKK